MISALVVILVFFYAQDKLFILLDRNDTSLQQYLKVDSIPSDFEVGAEETNFYFSFGIQPVNYDLTSMLDLNQYLTVTLSQMEWNLGDDEIRPEINFFEMPVHQCNETDWKYFEDKAALEVEFDLHMTQFCLDNP